jgi:hypothetical protein
MTENYGDAVRRRNAFVERRKRIAEEFKKIHPEGLIPANLKEAQAFFKKREREIKLEEKSSAGE